MHCPECGERLCHHGSCRKCDFCSECEACNEPESVLPDDIPAEEYERPEEPYDLDYLYDPRDFDFEDVYEDRPPMESSLGELLDDED